MAYAVKLFKPAVYLPVWMKLVHPGPQGCGLLPCVTWRRLIAFRAVQASSMGTFMGLAHHSHHSHTRNGPGGFLSQDVLNKFLLIRFSVFKDFRVAHELLKFEFSACPVLCPFKVLSCFYFS